MRAVAALLVLFLPAAVHGQPSGTVVESPYVETQAGFVNCGDTLGVVGLLVPSKPTLGLRCAGFWHDRAAQDVHLEIVDATGLPVGAAVLFYELGVGTTPGGGFCGSGTFSVPAGTTHIEVVLYPYDQPCGGPTFATVGFVRATFA